MSTGRAFFGGIVPPKKALARDIFDVRVSRRPYFLGATGPFLIYAKRAIGVGKFQLLEPIQVQG